MTIQDITNALNVLHNNTFGGDYAGFYDISTTEAERIASRADDADDFENIWAGQSWWLDINN